MVDTIKYIGETYDNIPVYVYGISELSVKATLLEGRPNLSLIRVDKNNRKYFIKDRYKIYIDELKAVEVT